MFLQVKPNPNLSFKTTDTLSRLMWFFTVFLYENEILKYKEMGVKNGEKCGGDRRRILRH